MMNILKPIVDLITKVESNDPLIHIIHSEINKLEEVLIELLPHSPLQKSEETIVLQKIVSRKEFALGPIHLAASLLNPSTQGSNLTSEQLLSAMEFICDLASKMKLHVAQVRSELADYREKEGLWSKRFIWEGVNDMNPLVWWRGLRGTNVLANIAIRILSAPVTSAATERSFSTFGWIHSKKRNRLTTERAAKITYLAYNWKLLNKNKQKIVNKSDTVPNNDPSIPSCSTSTPIHPEDQIQQKQVRKRAFSIRDEEIEEVEKIETEDSESEDKSDSDMLEEDIPYEESDYDEIDDDYDVNDKDADVGIQHFTAESDII